MCVSELTERLTIDRMGIMEICKLSFQTNKNPGSLVREGMPEELFCGGGSREQAHLGNQSGSPMSSHRISKSHA
jgi:hypothetical protein